MHCGTIKIDLINSYIVLVWVQFGIETTTMYTIYMHCSESVHFLSVGIISCAGLLALTHWIYCKGVRVQLSTTVNKYTYIYAQPCSYMYTVRSSELLILFIAVRSYLVLDLRCWLLGNHSNTML